MPAEIGSTTKWLARSLYIAGLLAGLGLLLAAATSALATWWCVVGAVLTALGGGFVVSWISTRLRYPTPEARARRLAQLKATHDTMRAVVDRSKLAHRATKYGRKRKVLRTGRAGTALVTFIADCGRGSEYQQLVYLELEVRVGDSAPYQACTGEYLTAAATGSVAPGRQLSVKVDPTDPQQVAVDWDSSLRLSARDRR